MTVEEMQTRLVELDDAIDAALIEKEVAALKVDEAKAVVKALRDERNPIAAALKVLDGLDDAGVEMLRGVI